MRPSGAILASTVSDPQAHWRMLLLLEQNLNVRFSASFKCPVRRVPGKLSRQRTQGGRAAEADARLCLGAIVLGMGCAGDRSWPWDGSGRGRPIRCCRAPHIGASACLRKNLGGAGAGATRPAGNRTGLASQRLRGPLCRRTPAIRRQLLGPGLCVAGPRYAAP